MTDYRSLYDKEFIGAWDLDEKDRIVLITRVQGGSLVGQGGRKSKKPIIYMSGTDKGFAVNATNGKTIASMYGNHIEQWAGKKIALYKSTTRNPNGDGEVECIRVRPRVPAAGSSPNLQQAPAEEDKFSTTKATAEQIEAIHVALSESGVELAAFLSKAEITDLADLPAADAPKGIEWIRKQKKRAA